MRIEWLMLALGPVSDYLAASVRHDPGYSPVLSLAVLTIPVVAAWLRLRTPRFDRRFAAAIRVAGWALTALAMVAAWLIVEVGTCFVLSAAAFVPFDVLTALVVAVAVATLGAVAYWAMLGTERDAPFNWGAAAFGWPALVVALAPCAWDRVPLLSSAVVTHHVYPILYLWGYPEPSPARPSLHANWNDPLARGQSSPAPRGYLRFQRVAHCIFALVGAVASGLACTALAGRRSPQPTPELGPVGHTGQSLPSLSPA